MKTRAIPLYVSSIKVTYFNSFGVKHIPINHKTSRQRKYHNNYLQNTGLSSIIKYHGHAFALDLLILCSKSKV